MRHLVLSGVAAAAIAFAPAALAQEQTIVTVAQGTDALSTLVQAVVAGELVDTLSGTGPFTVFAPTNEAFAALPDGTVESLLQPENRDQLQAVLTYHVVAGEVTSEQLLEQVRGAGGTLELSTVQGGTLTAVLEGETLTLRDVAGNEIGLVQTDVAASNGVVHVIDGVLLPTS